MNRACANGGAPAKGSRRRGRSQEPLRGASLLGSTAYRLWSFKINATVSPTAALCALHPIFLRPPSAGAATAFPSSLMTTTPAGPQATFAMEPLKLTAAGVALALRRGPLFFKAGRCGTRPQAATQLVGAVALVVVEAADRTAARPEPPGRRTRVGLSSLSRALPNFRRRARASASPRRLAGILSGALLPRAQFRFCGCLSQIAWVLCFDKVPQRRSTACQRLRVDCAASGFATDSHRGGARRCPSSADARVTVLIPVSSRGVWTAAELRGAAARPWSRRRAGASGRRVHLCTCSTTKTLQQNDYVSRTKSSR